MTEQLYSLHVDQWPAAVDVTVKIVSPDDGRERVTVEAIDGFPFAHGYSLPVYSQDMWWYRETIVNRSRLAALPPALLACHWCKMAADPTNDSVTACPFHGSTPAPSGADDDPTSMADFATFGGDPDERDREAEAGRARMGF